MFRQFLPFAWGALTLPSALRCFTSELGMGSGGDYRATAARQILFQIPNLTVYGADTRVELGTSTLQGCALPTEPYQHTKFDARAVPTRMGRPTLPSALRYASLLSSGMGQVGPPRYGRRANFVLCL